MSNCTCTSATTDVRRLTAFAMSIVSTWCKLVQIIFTICATAWQRVILSAAFWQTSTQIHISVCSTSLLFFLTFLHCIGRCCGTYKVLTTGQPTYLCTLLNHYTPLRTLHSANQYLLQHLWVSTEFAKRSFSYLAPKIWNNIPLDIRLCSTLPAFKRHLKTYLFK